MNPAAATSTIRPSLRGWIAGDRRVHVVRVPAEHVNERVSTPAPGSHGDVDECDRHRDRDDHPETPGQWGQEHGDEGGDEQRHDQPHGGAKDLRCRGLIERALEPEEWVDRKQRRSERE
jgi:hypothetical protein